MNSRLLGAISIILVFNLSCKKEEIPDPMQGTPVFTFLSTDGQIDIKAGNDDLYLFTEYERDSLDVMRFIARFAKLESCQGNCSEELIIELRDVQVTSSNTEIDINESLYLGEHPFYKQDVISSGPAYVLDLTAAPEGTAPFTYSWNLTYGNETITSLASDFSYTAELANNLDSLYVCLSTADANGCQANSCELIRLTPNALQSCNADFSWSYIQGGGLIELSAADSLLTGNAPYTYMWNTGEVTSSILVSPNNIQNPYCLTVTDASACSASACKAFSGNPVGGLEICSSRFSYDSTYQPGSGNDFQFGAVKIQYTNAEGRVFRSDLQDQVSGSIFNINAMEDYDNNENGEKTKKLEISGHCQLFAENGEILQFPFSSVIAIAYP